MGEPQSKSRAFPFFLPFRLLAVSTALDGIGSDSTQLVRVAPCLLVFFFGFDMEQHVFLFFVLTVSLRAHQEDAGDSSGFFFFLSFNTRKKFQPFDRNEITIINVALLLFGRLEAVRRRLSQSHRQSADQRWGAAQQPAGGGRDY